MNKATALIIEDTSVLADLFAHAMQSAGFETEIVDDGEMALQRLQETIPDVILLDLNLPFVPGEEILAHIRADSRLMQTRVIVSTGYSDFPDIVYKEADLILQKPISYTQLLRLAGRFHPDFEPVH